MRQCTLFFYINMFTTFKGVHWQSIVFSNIWYAAALKFVTHNVSAQYTVMK